MKTLQERTNIEAGTRECNDCGAWKPLSPDFALRGFTAKGEEIRSATCKPCEYQRKKLKKEKQ